MRKRSFLEYRKNRGMLKLNLGCGRMNTEDYWGMDIQDLEGVDEVADITKGIPREDMLFHEVLCHDFLEHIPQEKCIAVMEDIYRVIRPGGFVNITVPSTDAGGHGAFQDPTHISFWNETKFRYFCHEKHGGFRQLYDIKAWFKPKNTLTYLNQWRVPYVNVVLERELNEQVLDN